MPRVTSTVPDAQPVVLSGEDAQRLAVLHARCFPDAWSSRAFSELMDGTGIVALGVEDSSAPPAQAGKAEDPGLVAAVLARVLFEQSEILTICVAPDRRRQGYGKSVLSAAMAAAARLGATTMTLEANAGNGAALSLYERMGFHPVATRVNYYEVGEGCRDAILLQITLKE